MSHKFPIKVLLCIVAKPSDDHESPSKVAFEESEDNVLQLPGVYVGDFLHANQIAVNLLQELVPVNLELITIEKMDFFDPILPEIENRPNRELLLVYRTTVSPRMPVAKRLVFMSHDELKVAQDRIKPGHLMIFRQAIAR